ncbi:hypothetical protein [Pseudoalteromonas sp. G4]|uniref:hypothetical protein n=1 Tax=Pseudoalteromonas sp. G4 TaxID=2992761 RepID=UPI00237ED48B|nr:hypothetical protein [Pseudoalteromonas sp. G4]MDE3271857.1 hypothetical protein [Pseudoalteromonas sp. G4]
MEHALKQAKSLAKLLLKEAKSGNADILKRLKKYYRIDVDTKANVKLKMCQHLVAKDTGLADWQQLHELLSAQQRREGEKINFGSVFHTSGCDRFLNKWFATYAEAKSALTQYSYLVPYKHQFIVVKAPYFTEIGIQDKQLLNNDLVAVYPSEYWDMLAAKVFAHTRTNIMDSATKARASKAL